MTPTPPRARDIWQEFHWAFFIDTQGLILCMKRFALCLDRKNWSAAELELDAATGIMRASAAAMVLAGSFTKEEYETEVRVSMAPPHVASDGFSGLMSWEHGALVNLWRSLRDRFADLPEVLKPAHARFTAAYKAMSDGHVHVCAKFVGEAGASLRNEKRDAILNLQRFGDNRMGLINPPAKAQPQGVSS